MLAMGARVRKCKAISCLCRPGRCDDEGLRLENLECRGIVLFLAWSCIEY